MEDQAPYYTRATIPEPPPEGLGEIVLGYVVSDLTARAEFGRAKYGTYLRTRNGRDPLWDAYQEALDLVMYLRQAIIEREHEQSAKKDRPHDPAVPRVSAGPGCANRGV